MTIDSKWSARGYGEADLRVEVKELDEKTKILPDCSSADIEILSYGGDYTAKDGREIVAFQPLNKETIASTKKTKIFFEPHYVEKKNISGLYEDFVENGCLLRTDVLGKAIWIAPDRHIFNQLGFTGGTRFAAFDPGFARNLLLEQTMVDNPEGLNLLLRQDDGFNKLISVSRGKFEYVSQRFFVDCISAFIDEANESLRQNYPGKDWEWMIAGWELDHYMLTVRVENPAFAKEMRKNYDVDVIPTVIFMNSETGDSSMIGNACLTVDGSDSVIKSVTKRHAANNAHDLTEKFIESCNELPELLIDDIIRLEKFKKISVAAGVFEVKVKSLGLLDEETGKRGGKKEIVKLIENEKAKSDKEDATYYDIARRVLSIPGKLKKPWVIAPLTGAILQRGA